MGNLLLRGELAPQAAQATQHERQPAPGIGVAQQPQQVFQAWRLLSEQLRLGHAYRVAD